MTERLDPLTHTPPRVYEGQSVVSLTVETVRQLRAAHTLIESSWTERPGLGTLVAQVDSDRIEALEALGLDPVVLIEDLQAHRDAAWSRLRDATRRDRRLGIADPAGRAAPLGTGVHDEAWFSNFRQYADILSYFDDLIAARPALITRSDIGDSIESRDIYAYTITAPDETGNPSSERPVVLYTGTQHAREWISPMTVTYIASRLVDGYGGDAGITDLLDSTRVVIVPVVNPDGYLYSWSTQRFWRKNRRNVSDSPAFGVDLNRNWGTAFGGTGASENPNSNIYHGASAFSEPETDAVRALANSFGADLAAYTDYHSYSQLILWPLGYESGLVTPEPDRSFFQDLSGDMSALIQSISGVFYDPIQSWRLYPAAGTASDWFYDDRGATSFTIELRPDGSDPDGFAPPPSTILPTAQENLEAAKLFAARATRPLFLAHDAVSIIDASAATPVTLQATDGLSTVDPSSVTLWTAAGSAPFTPTPMTAQGGDAYGADLPAAPCGETVAYYFSADTLSGQTFTFPSAGSGNPLTALAQETTLVVFDDMETDTGWSVGAPGDTATTGVWERADPEGTDAQPENDHTPGGTDCWITGADAGSSLGSFDIDAGVTTLTSPALDASDPDAQIAYRRWYSNDRGASPGTDAMVVEISDDDGATWTELEIVTENANAWVERRFEVGDVVTPSASVRLRFKASDLGDGSIVEAGVDDLRVETVGCPGSAADLNGDGTVDFSDVNLFTSAFGNQDPIADINNDGEVDFADVNLFTTLFAEG